MALTCDLTLGGPTMSCSRTLKGMLASALMFCAVGVMACGESLFRVGQGSRFSYTAPISGTILIVAYTESGRTLANLLAESGHDVHVVSSASEISAELGERSFDVVLALFSERKVVEAQMAAFETAFLPVATVEERDLARDLYSKALTTGDSLKRYLRTIHRTLKEAQA